MPDYTLDVRSIAAASARPQDGAASALHRHVATLPTVRAGGAVHQTQGARRFHGGASARPSLPSALHARGGEGRLPRDGLHAAGQDTLVAGIGRRPMPARHDGYRQADMHGTSTIDSRGRGSDTVVSGGRSRTLSGGHDATAPRGADTLSGGFGRHSGAAEADAAPLAGVGKGTSDATPLDGQHGDDTIFGGMGGLTANVQRAVAVIATGTPDPQHATAVEFAATDTLSVHSMTIDFAGGPTGIF